MDGNESLLRVVLSSESGAGAGGHSGRLWPSLSPRARPAVVTSGAGRGGSSAGGGGPLGLALAPPWSSLRRARLASVCPSSLSSGRARRCPVVAASSSVAGTGGGGCTGSAVAGRAGLTSSSSSLMRLTISTAGRLGSAEGAADACETTGCGAKGGGGGAIEAVPRSGAPSLACGEDDCRCPVDDDVSRGGVRFDVARALGPFRCGVTGHALGTAVVCRASRRTDAVPTPPVFLRDLC